MAGRCGVTRVKVEHFTKPGRGFLGRPLRATRVETERADVRIVEFYVEGELLERTVEPIEIAVSKR